MSSLLRHQGMLIFAAAVVFIALFQALVPDALRLNSTDYSAYYEQVAKSLLEGHGFRLADGRFASANPPLYPLIAAGLLGLARQGIPEEFLFNIFNAACLAVSVAVIYHLARELWGERGGLLAAGLWLTYPFVLLLSTDRLTEPLFIALLYSGLALFWRSLRTQTLGGFALAAALLGAAMLTRSIALGILPVCVLIVGIAQLPLHLKRSASVVLLGIGFLVVLPWTAAIYAQTGQLVLLGTNSVPSVRDGLTFAVGKAYRQTFQLSSDVVAVMERFFERRYQMDSLGAILSAVREEFLRSPKAVIELLLLKAARSWYATDSGQQETLSLLIQLVYLSSIGLSSWRAFKIAPQQRTYLLGTWLIVAYFWLMTFLVLSILRYMTPIMGLLLTIVPSLISRRHPTEPHAARSN
jgi:4-amino-4-deoxy-L-arabinose transferase-like glycosyltransferase